MSMHSRCRAFGALMAMLALGAAPKLQAQDTAAARHDTSGYQGYQPQAGDTSQAATPDTALKAKPGTQTGPAKNDTSGAAGPAEQVKSRTVVCKDGSNDSTATAACAQHGGVDSVATRAAWKARGEMPAADSSKDTTAAPR